MCNSLYGFYFVRLNGDGDLKTTHTHTHKPNLVQKKYQIPIEQISCGHSNVFEIFRFSLSRRRRSERDRETNK